jgi:hypothetical protein
MVGLLQNTTARFGGTIEWSLSIVNVLVMSGLVLLCSSPVEAAIQLRVDQVGNDVVVTGSGRANLSGLTFVSTANDFQNIITDIQIFAGPNSFNAGQVDYYDGVLTGPTTISSNFFLVEEPDPTASSGNLFGIQADIYRLILPQGYTTNTDLSGISTFRNVTIAGMGLTPGTGTWTWGSIANGTFDSINLVVVPGPLPIAGAAITFGWARKLRRRSTLRRKVYKA